jgi:hypothetical protein
LSAVISRRDKPFWPPPSMTLPFPPAPAVGTPVAPRRRRARTGCVCPFLMDGAAESGALTDGEFDTRPGAFLLEKLEAL